MINLLAFIEEFLRNNIYKFKGEILRHYLIFHGCKVKGRLRCHEFPKFRLSPRRNINIGSNVTVGEQITFEIHKSGKLVIGDNVKLTHDILLSAGLSIEIGNNTLIGERVSIRDGNHSTKSSDIILNQPSLYKSVKIGQDVWLAAGSIVLAGSTIPDAAVIGANSVVLERSEIKENGIYAGSPVKFIRMRN